MPYSLPLPNSFKSQGWKVKIRDKERLEPPHITIMHRTREWRLGLRDGQFLIPPGGSWGKIPSEVRSAITADQNWQGLKSEWDARYPENPI